MTGQPEGLANPLLDFTAWQATLSMTPLSGLVVEIRNPHGRIVTVYVLDAEMMWRLRDLKPSEALIAPSGQSTQY